MPAIAMISVALSSVQNWPTTSATSRSATSVTSLDNLATLKLMAGGKVGRGLLYATVGGTWADVSSDAGDPDDGYLYGIGYDHMLNDRWSIGAELLRHTWDSFDDAGTDADATTLQAKVGFRF